jgi:hypothetical protein
MEKRQKGRVTHVHDTTKENGPEGDIDIGPLFAEAIEELKAHVSVGRDNIIVTDDACSCGGHIFFG